jgi:hypothetical protein
VANVGQKPAHSPPTCVELRSAYVFA